MLYLAWPILQKKKEELWDFYICSCSTAQLATVVGNGRTLAAVSAGESQVVSTVCGIHGIRSRPIKTRCSIQTVLLWSQKPVITGKKPWGELDLTSEVLLDDLRGLMWNLNFRIHTGTHTHTCGATKLQKNDFYCSTYSRPLKKQQHWITKVKPSSFRGVTNLWALCTSVLFFQEFC